jgi:25S rRNA (adenine2142-N1)-methyltransferase
MCAGMQVTDGIVEALPAQAFDVVIFSLLLSYMPSPRQRFACCAKARQVLKTNGLLLIITPDSNHVGKVRSSFRQCHAAL